MYTGAFCASCASLWPRFEKMMNAIPYNKEFEIKALASQSYLLSKRVYVKHLLINSGFVLSGASLIFFLASGISYLVGFR